MENIKKFINSIYLGDRFCEKFQIKDKKIVFQINCISRLKDGTKKWNYYSEEDIEHGCIVFDDVSGYCWSKKLPFNDEIHEIEIIGKKDTIYSFVVYGCNISEDAVSTDIELRIDAKRIYILNPQNGSVIDC